MQPTKIQIPTDLADHPSVKVLTARLRDARIRNPAAVAVLMTEELLFQFEKSAYCSGLEHCLTFLCLEDLDEKLKRLVDVPYDLSLRWARHYDDLHFVQFLIDCEILKPETEDGTLFTSPLYDGLHSSEQLDKIGVAGRALDSADTK